MFRLVYTSAPRLLDAGKTGFGVVAATRGMPRPLISYLERISAFDRAAAVSSLLFYSSYRMGAALFHVFSRVGDCGADYTGRTNHLAEHFVVEQGTADDTLLRATTPAAALLALQGQWTARWDAQPERLDECTMPAGVPQVAYGEWGKLTGDEENAAWLSSSHLRTPCCLVLPTHADESSALRLLHDGMLRRKDHGWGCGFSTAVVSTMGGLTFRCLSGVQQRAEISTGRDPLLTLAPGMVLPPAEPVAAVDETPTYPSPSTEAPHASASSVVEIFPMETVGEPGGSPATSAPVSLPSWHDAPASSVPSVSPKVSNPRREVEEEKSFASHICLVVAALLLLMGGIWWNAQDGASESSPRKTSSSPAVSSEKSTTEPEAKTKPEKAKEKSVPQKDEPAPNPQAAQDGQAQDTPAPVEEIKAEEMPGAVDDAQTQKPSSPEPDSQEGSAEPPSETEPAPPAPATSAPAEPAPAEPAPAEPEERVWKVMGKATLLPKRKRNSSRNKNVQFSLSYNECRTALGIELDMANLKIVSLPDGVASSADELSDSQKVIVTVPQGLHRSCYLLIRKAKEEGINIDLSVEVKSINWIEEELLENAEKEIKRCEAAVENAQREKKKVEKRLEKLEEELAEARKQKNGQLIKDLEDKKVKITSPKTPIGKAREKETELQRKCEELHKELHNLQEMQKIYQKENPHFSN